MRKIEILGRGPNRREPNLDCESWYLSTAVKDHETLRPWDKVFSLHGNKLVEPWLFNERSTVLKEPCDALPLATVLDDRLFEAKYGRVFACSAAWMIAYAIDEQVDEILLNGLDMLRDFERRQRESVALLCGWAKASGIMVRAVVNSGFTMNYGSYPER